MHLHTGKNLEIYQKWTLNQANQNDWTNETWKKCPMKVIQATMRVLLSLIPPVCLSICTLFPPNKHFTCFITCLLCGNYFLQSWEARVLSLRTASISGREPKPLFKLLQAEVTRDHSHFTILLWDNTSSVKKQTKAPKNKRSKPSSWNLVMSNRYHCRLWALSFWVSMGRKSPSLKLPALGLVG